MGTPEVGSFLISDFIYEGVKWDVVLINRGDVPVLAKNINIDINNIAPHDPMGPWLGVGNLCDLVDENGVVLKGRAITVDGSSNRKLSVVLCREESIPEQRRVMKAGYSTVMRIEVFQQLELRKMAGWIDETSEEFKFPAKFSRVLKNTPLF